MMLAYEQYSNVCMHGRNFTAVWTSALQFMVCMRLRPHVLISSCKMRI